MQSSCGVDNYCINSSCLCRTDAVIHDRCRVAALLVADALQIPVKFVGVGEQADDLMPFEAKDFVEALI